MRLWHVSCLLLFSGGCLYLGPPWEKPVNQPPIILSPPNLVGNELPMVGDVAKPRVVARDPDGDVLHFEWVVPGDFLLDVEDLTSLEEGVQGSMATIARDERLHGNSIWCVVTDYVNPGRQVEWEVQVWE